MKLENIWENIELEKVLIENKIVVMPTDTVYGIVCRADSVDSVERVYDIRKRRPDKACIILIADYSDLENFKIFPSDKQMEQINKYWPGPVSIIFDCPHPEYFYLHRGGQTLAFRLPNNTSLRDLIRKTGPILVPSANHEGFPVSKNIEEAKRYFNEEVDLYIDGGEVIGEPSKVIKINEDGSLIIIRK